jgi:hypothetical protein
MRVHEMFVFILALFTVGLLTLVPTLVIVDGGKIEYADLVVIILAAVTVVLAALAIGLGALALWGYKEFMTKADDSAKKVAESTTNDYLKRPEFREILLQAAKQVLIAETNEQAVSGVVAEAAPQPVDPINAGSEPFQDVGPDMGRDA